MLYSSLMVDGQLVISTIRSAPRNKASLDVIGNENNGTFVLLPDPLQLIFHHHVTGLGV